ncbi:MAG: 7-cyano-7-deazaguanine synthase [Candidatus Thermoplasmatota archaeon]|nr:7-cyano-7-deazaguanine synthase [Candidatus Thermoplasmatota archaeon]
MRGIVLLSGGIDSPVAAYLMGRRGLELVLAHFDNRPFTSDAEIDKAISLMRRLDEALGTTSKKLLVPHGKAQTELARECRRNMQCVLCRRMMFRVAERLARRMDARYVVTGESLGQVASQTLANMNVEERATSLPILRPLIGLDKVEIERIAKNIGTYEISTGPGLCCTIAPKRPSTYARQEDAAREEAKVDIEKLAEEESEGAFEIS